MRQQKQELSFPRGLVQPMPQRGPLKSAISVTPNVRRKHYHVNVVCDNFVRLRDALSFSAIIITKICHFQLDQFPVITITAITHQHYLCHTDKESKRKGNIQEIRVFYEHAPSVESTINQACATGSKPAGPNPGRLSQFWPKFEKSHWKFA